MPNIPGWGSQERRMKRGRLHSRGNPRAPRPVGPAMVIRKLELAALRQWEWLEARIAAPGRPPQWRPLARRALALARELGVLAGLPFFVVGRGLGVLEHELGSGVTSALAGAAG